MSSFALVYDLERDTRRVRLLRQAPARARARPWNEVAMARMAAPTPPRKTVPLYAWLLMVGVVASHVGLVWYVKHHSTNAAPKIRREVAVEFVQPPKPQPQKIEPPKPAPPKPQAQKPAQVLPPIEQPNKQTSADRSNEGESAEPPVAVAPIASAPVEAPPEQPVTAAFGRAGYLNNPPPDYPAVAARQGWQGTVLLKVRVLANGKVESVEVQQSSGRKVLDDEAMRTVKKWSFSPSKRGDTPIDGWATVPIEFKLEQ